MRILLMPYTLLTGVVGRYPWQTLALCVALTVIGVAAGHPGYGVWAALFGAIVLIWLGERGRAKPLEFGIAAGD
jgi:hypothetical protein